MVFQRFHLQELKKRMDEPRGFIQVILGPRQVGKTTLVQQFLQNTRTPSHFVSADGATEKAWLDQQWDIAETLHKHAGGREFLLVIDEIQKIHNWSETIKARWDANTRDGLAIKVVLLGSSRLLLQHGLTESLTGRFETLFMGHWSLAEMETAFGWTPEQYVWFGGYPGSARLIDDETRWKRYVADALIETGITRDILLLTRVEKPALMRSLFELGCQFTGKILSYNKMLGQFTDAGNTTTLAHYLALLDTAGLLGGLAKYAGSSIRQRASSPKFQVYNNALVSANRSEQFDTVVRQPQLWGHLVESAVGAHLLNFSRQEHYNLFYWREGNDEVDFVLERRGKAVAVEVKSGSPRSIGGLKAFQKRFGATKSVLVGQGGIPWADFLRMNPGGLLE